MMPQLLLEMFAVATRRLDDAPRDVVTHGGIVDLVLRDAPAAVRDVRRHVHFAAASPQAQLSIVDLMGTLMAWRSDHARAVAAEAHWHDAVVQRVAIGEAQQRAAERELTALRGDVGRLRSELVRDMESLWDVVGTLREGLSTLESDAAVSGRGPWRAVHLTSDCLEAPSRSDCDASVTPPVPVIALSGVYDPLAVPSEPGLLAREDLRRLASVSRALYGLAVDADVARVMRASGPSDSDDD